MNFPGGYVLVGTPKTPTPAYQKVLFYVDAATSRCAACSSSTGRATATASTSEPEGQRDRRAEAVQVRPAAGHVGRPSAEPSTAASAPVAAAHVSARRGRRRPLECCTCGMSDAFACAACAARRGPVPSVPCAKCAVRRREAMRAPALPCATGLERSWRSPLWVCASCGGPRVPADVMEMARRSRQYAALDRRAIALASRRGSARVASTMAHPRDAWGSRSGRVCQRYVERGLAAAELLIGAPHRARRRRLRSSRARTHATASRASGVDGDVRRLVASQRAA